MTVHPCSVVLTLAHLPLWRGSALSLRVLALAGVTVALAPATGHVLVRGFAATAHTALSTSNIVVCGPLCWSIQPKYGSATLVEVWGYCSVETDSIDMPSTRDRGTQLVSTQFNNINMTCSMFLFCFTKLQKTNFCKKTIIRLMFT